MIKPLFYGQFDWSVAAEILPWFYTKDLIYSISSINPIILVLLSWFSGFSFHDISVCIWLIYFFTILGTLIWCFNHLFRCIQSIPLSEFELGYLTKLIWSFWKYSSCHSILRRDAGAIIQSILLELHFNFPNYCDYSRRFYSNRFTERLGKCCTRLTGRGNYLINEFYGLNSPPHPHYLFDCGGKRIASFKIVLNVIHSFGWSLQRLN